MKGRYGIGELTSVAILAELGDCRRFSCSRYAVRYGGPDITVHASDPAARPVTSPARVRVFLSTRAVVCARRGRED